MREAWGHRPPCQGQARSSVLGARASWRCGICRCLAHHSAGQGFGPCLGRLFPAHCAEHGCAAHGHTQSGGRWCLTPLVWGDLVGSLATPLALPWVWSTDPGVDAAVHGLGIGVAAVDRGDGGHGLSAADGCLSPPQCVLALAFHLPANHHRHGAGLWQDFPQALSWMGMALVCASGVGIAV